MEPLLYSLSNTSKQKPLGIGCNARWRSKAHFAYEAQQALRVKPCNELSIRVRKCLGRLAQPAEGKKLNLAESPYAQKLQTLKTPIPKSQSPKP